MERERGGEKNSTTTLTAAVQSFLFPPRPQLHLISQKLCNNNTGPIFLYARILLRTGSLRNQLLLTQRATHTTRSRSLNISVSTSPSAFRHMHVSGWRTGVETHRESRWCAFGRGVPCCGLGFRERQANERGPAPAAETCSLFSKENARDIPDSFFFSFFFFVKCRV